MQLPNPAAALIKATGTFSPANPAAFHHLQHTYFSLPEPTPFPPAARSPGKAISPTEEWKQFHWWCCCCAVRGAEPLCHRKKLPALKCTTMCKIRTHAYEESDVLVQAQPWHCPSSWASRFQKLLRVTGRTGRVRRGWGPGLLASRE